MADFQATLDEAIEQREKTGKKEKKRKPLNSVFSFRAFMEGIGICTLLLLSLVMWLLSEQEGFFGELQSRLPSKAALIIKDSIGSQSATVIKMPPATNPSNVQKISNDNATPLTPSPITGLYENNIDGLLPIRTNNQTPFDAYRNKYKPSGSKTTLSVIITDMGISAGRSREIINNLPANVSLSFSPYANDLKKLTDYARMNGHEVWLTLPMETKNYPAEDPGDLTLFVNTSIEKSAKRLSQILGSTDGYVGFVTTKNHAFTPEDGDIKPVIQNIFKRGLAIIDTNPYKKNFAGFIARNNEYPHGKNNLWIDEVLGEANALITLKQASNLGMQRDHVTIILRPYPSSIKALTTFLSSEQGQQFELAPASATVKYE